MNDSLKDFVERHREDFDHLDAPQFNLELMKAARNPVKSEQKAITFDVKKWLVAASAVLIIATTVLIFKISAPKKDQSLAKTDVAPPMKAVPDNTIEVEQALADLKADKKPKTARKRLALPKSAAKSNLDDFYEKLSDSSSASNRLAAVLAIDKSGLISERTINILDKTLEYDGNSNVRLAALGVMAQYKNDTHVSILLVNALKNQTDPMVQLALVNLLGTMDNVKIDESLHALVSNPETFSAVKDEAYSILMREDKL
ncbi:hypothetical protein [Pedobacter endophyticus]|uniref:HEAT repeat-containing protein n=1 Tax=Pedobacter endophyticus TaxID=2789740 RepID=A0A7U3Q3S8_9SPHI|nr:hypothetical protein [Pedobacter endophyticus]QPH37829.1 hypothetical protein IZT61_11975 [Pedobacter endophyticus]